MKKNYCLLLLLAFLSINFINAQTVCPTSIGNQSSVSTLHFKIISGSCGDYPQGNPGGDIFVTQSGFSATYIFASCNGTNLKYDYLAGDTLPSEDTFVVDWNATGICNYINGELGTLSNNDVKLNESVSIYPNPLIKQRELNLKFATNLSAKVYMYDVTGKLAIRDEVNNANNKKINTSALTNGIYFLKIATDKASITRKVIIMN